MAVLRGADALAYLQSNPQGSFKVLGGGESLGWNTGFTQSAPKPGGIGGLISNIFDPITKWGDLMDYANLKAAGTGEAEQFTPQYGYTPDEWQAAKDRGLWQEFIKSGAGQAAFVVPGSGLKSALASGGLSGLSQTEDITKPEDLVSGVGTGMATAGATYGALKGLEKGVEKLKGTGMAAKETGEELGKVAQFGEDVRIKDLSLKMPKTPTGVSEQKMLGRQIIQTLDDRGLPTNAKGMDTAFRQLSGEFSEAVSKNPKMIDTAPLYDEFTTFAKKKGGDLSKRGTARATYEFYAEPLMEKPQISTAELANLKQAVQGKMSNVYTKINKGTTLRPGEGVMLAYRDVLDKSLKKAVPEAADTLNQMSAFHKAAPDIISATQKGQKVGLPLGTGIRINVRGVTSPIRQKIGKGLMAVGQNQVSLPNIPGLSNIPTQGLQTVLPRAAAMSGIGQGIGQQPATSNYGWGMAPGGLPQPTGAGTGLYPTQQMSTGASTPQQAGTGLAQVQDPMQQKKQMLMQALMMTGGDIDAAMKMTEFFTPEAASGPGKMTEAQAQYGLAANAAKTAYQTLLSNPNVTGPIAGRKAGLAAKFGQASDATQYRTQIDTMNSFIRRAMLGSGQTESELSRIESMLPKNTDSAEIAQQKFEQIIPLLESYGIRDGQQQEIVPSQGLNASYDTNMGYGLM